VRVSLNDSQVPYWEGTKLVAKLRELKTDKNPLLLKINMGAGHGGASGRYDALHDVAFDYAFVLTQLGVTN
jgi:oligopeptidase B